MPCPTSPSPAFPALLKTVGTEVIALGLASLLLEFPDAPVCRFGPLDEFAQKLSLSMSIRGLAPVASRNSAAD